MSGRDRERMARAVGDDPALVGMVAGKMAIAICDRATRSGMANAVLESNEGGYTIEGLRTLGTCLCTGRGVARNEAAGLAHLAAAAGLEGREALRRRGSRAVTVGDSVAMIAHAMAAVELGRAAWRAAGLDCSRFARDLIGAMQCDCFGGGGVTCEGCTCPHHRGWCDRDPWCDRAHGHEGDCAPKK